MKTPPRPPQIDDFGLQHWIDSGRYKQNGYGYKDFDLFCELKVPAAIIGRIFNKSVKTVKDWQARRTAMQTGDKL